MRRLIGGPTGCLGAEEEQKIAVFWWKWHFFFQKQPFYIFNVANTKVHKPPYIISYKFYLVQAGLLHFNLFQTKPRGSPILTHCFFFGQDGRKLEARMLGARILGVTLHMQVFSEKCELPCELSQSNLLLSEPDQSALCRDQEKCIFRAFHQSEKSAFYGAFIVQYSGFIQCGSCFGPPSP